MQDPPEGRSRIMAATSSRLPSSPQGPHCKVQPLDARADQLQALVISGLPKEKPQGGASSHSRGPSGTAGGFPLGTILRRWRRALQQSAAPGWKCSEGTSSSSAPRRPRDHVEITRSFAWAPCPGARCHLEPGSGRSDPGTTQLTCESTSSSQDAHRAPSGAASASSADTVR